MYTLKSLIFNGKFLMIIEKMKFENVQTFHFFIEDFWYFEFKETLLKCIGVGLVSLYLVYDRAQNKKSTFFRDLFHKIKVKLI